MQVVVFEDVSPQIFRKEQQTSVKMIKVSENQRGSRNRFKWVPENSVRPPNLKLYGSPTLRVKCLIQRPQSDSKRTPNSFLLFGLPITIYILRTLSKTRMITIFVTQSQSSYYSVIAMLAINNAKISSILLIITTATGLSAAIGAFVVMIIKQYFGFGVYGNPISCTGSSTSSFQSKKFVQSSNYINSSDAGVIVSIIAGTTALILLIVFLIKLPKASQKQQQQQQRQWSTQFHNVLYVCFAVGTVTLVIPIGYFTAFIAQVTKLCGTSLSYEWIIVAGLSALALILYVFNIAYLLKISNTVEEPNQAMQPIQSKRQERKEQDKIYNHLEEVRQEPEKDTLPRNEITQARQQIPTFYQADTFQNQSFKQQNNQMPNPRNQSIREPLLAHDPLVSKVSQDSYESNRINQLRRQRREQEQKLWELQRKKKLLQMDFKQKPEIIQQKIIVQPQRAKDKENGNQTIINIHLASSQPNIQPVTEQPKAKQQVPIIATKKEKSKPKKLKKAKKSNTIYEEDSEDNSDDQYDGRKKFQTNERYKPYSRIQTSSRMFNNNIMASQKLEESQKEKKKLSLSHLHSVQISPSPQAFSEKIAKQPEESRMNISHNPPKMMETEKNQQSFFRKLLDQSQIPQRKPIEIPQRKAIEFKAPTKPKIKPPKKASFQQKKSLDDYIQALNVSMMNMRSAYEQEYVSQKSNYSSVLSGKDSGMIPAENVERNRLSSFLNKQKLGARPQTLSLSEIQQKIRQKYKNG